MYNIEDILKKTDHLSKVNESQKLDEVTANQVWNGVKNVFRTNVFNDQNKELYKSNLKVLQSFEQILNSSNNDSVIIANKSAEDIMSILNNKFANNADWYAVVTNTPSQDTDNSDSGEEQPKPAQNGNNQEGSSEKPINVNNGEVTVAPNENAIQEAMEFLADYNQLLLEDLADYAQKNQNKNDQNKEKQKRKLLKQCRQILYKQGGKSNTLVALYTALKQNAKTYNDMFKGKANSLTEFFKAWLNDKLMSADAAGQAHNTQIAAKANDTIIQCIATGYTDYNTFYNALTQMAGGQ